MPLFEYIGTEVVADGAECEPFEYRFVKGGDPVEVLERDAEIFRSMPTFREVESLKKKVRRTGRGRNQRKPAESGT